jgi:hypothetical protein
MMHSKIRVSIASVLVACAMVIGNAARSYAYQTLQVALFNVTNDQISVTWPAYNTSDPNSEIDPFEQAITGSQMLFLGQALIPTSSSEEDSSFIVGIQDATNGVNLEFSISATSCQYDAYAWALSNYLEFCHTSSEQDGSLMDGTNLLSYDINSDNMQVCLKGNPTTGINNSLNYNVGITQTDPPSSSEAKCYEPAGSWVPEYFPTLNVPDNAFGSNAQYYIALGSYAPNAGPAITSQAFAGLSPSGVSPCIGSMCNIPNNVENWPLTIYYYGVSGTSPGSFFPGFQYNSTATPSSSDGLILWNSEASVNPWGQGAINVPSYLSNYGNAGSEDIYTPIANSFPNIANMPMPCWPTFNTSDQAACNGEPLYTETQPIQQPAAKSSTGFESAVNFAASLVVLFSVF